MSLPDRVWLEKTQPRWKFFGQSSFEGTSDRKLGWSWLKLVARTLALMLTRLANDHNSTRIGSPPTERSDVPQSLTSNAEMGANEPYCGRPQIP